MNECVASNVLRFVLDIERVVESAVMSVEVKSKILQCTETSKILLADELDDSLSDVIDIFHRRDEAGISDWIFGPTRD